MIPPKANAAFVACMEDVLELYCRPYDPRIPMVNMDEQPVQLVKETRAPVPPGPGRPARYEYEYERNGTANIFLFTEPLGEWRRVEATGRRTAVDWAHQVRELLDVDYPRAERVILVCDNLNTHTTASLYEAFEPAEARRLARRLEIHYTPKHGSWLNIAEIELGLLTRMAMQRRIPEFEQLRAETKAWFVRRNAKAKSVDWQFTTESARTKLKRLYPQT